YGRIYFARARTERKFAALRCLEAIRLYAVRHDGKLPMRLDQIKEVPVPVDPFTGKPFEYEATGDRATLYSAARAAPVPGQKPNPQLALLYEIPLKRCRSAVGISSFFDLGSLFNAPSPVCRRAPVAGGCRRPRRPAAGGEDDSPRPARRRPAVAGAALPATARSAAAEAGQRGHRLPQGECDVEGSRFDYDPPGPDRASPPLAP